MAFFLVKVRRTVEFEGVYEADYPGVAEDLARIETNHHGETVDEDIIVQTVEEAEESRVN